MELSLGHVVGWGGRFGSWGCWKGGVKSEGVSRTGSGSGGEMAHPEEPRVLSLGEKGGRADFTGMLRLCAIQPVRKL